MLPPLPLSDPSSSRSLLTKRLPPIPRPGCHIHYGSRCSRLVSVWLHLPLAAPSRKRATEQATYRLSKQPKPQKPQSSTEWSDVLILTPNTNSFYICCLHTSTRPCPQLLMPLHLRRRRRRLHHHPVQLPMATRLTTSPPNYCSLSSATWAPITS